MKNLKTLLLFLLPFFSQAQTDVNWTAIRTKAEKENKLIMVVVQSKECEQCNSVAEAGLSRVKKELEAKCIPVYTTGMPIDIFGSPSFFITPKEMFGVIWFDKELNPLFIKGGSTSLSSDYTNAMNTALQELNSSGSYKILKDAYYKEIKNFSAVYNLLNKIKLMGFEPEGFLIDELVQKAPLDSASSLTFLTNVLRFAPLVNSIAQGYVQKNRDNYNMAWWRMDLRERININVRIGWKSIQKAIVEKNQGYANQVGYFSQSIYTDKPEDGARANMKTMLDYYKGVNDTASYMRQVFNFYDRYYMQLTVSDIKREDSMALLNATKNVGMNISEEVQKLMNEQMLKLGNSETQIAPGKVVSSKVVKYSPKAQFYANALNEGAWTVYTYTANSMYLLKALQMARKALEFSEQAAIADTYARLLYKTGNKTEAINWQKKAIEMEKTRGFSTQIFEQVLEKMQRGEASLD